MEYHGIFFKGNVTSQKGCETLFGRICWLETLPAEAHTPSAVESSMYVDESRTRSQPGSRLISEAAWYWCERPRVSLGKRRAPISWKANQNLCCLSCGSTYIGLCRISLLEQRAHHGRAPHIQRWKATDGKRKIAFSIKCKVCSCFRGKLFNECDKSDFEGSHKGISWGEKKKHRRANSFFVKVTTAEKTNMSWNQVQKCLVGNTWLHAVKATG